jgi:hypothetical protein
MGQGHSAPSGVPASAAATAPPAPKNSGKANSAPASGTAPVSGTAPNVLGGQSGGRSRRNRKRKNKSNRRNRH